MIQKTRLSLAVLHHMRWLAAFMVAISHIRQNLLLDYVDVKHPTLLDKLLFSVTAYGHAGVVVFFVLSGFLVGGKAITLLNSETVKTDWPHYLADRFSRIFIVLWPALLLCGLVLVFLRLEAPTAPFLTSAPWGWAINRPINGDFSVLRLVNAALLLNGLTAKTLQVDSPLWSLTYEWFYYMAALALVLMLRRVFSLSALAIMGYAVVLLALGLRLNPNMIVLSFVWVFGVIAKVTFDRGLLLNPLAKWAGLLMVVAALIVDRAISLPDLFLGALIAFMVAHRGWAEWRGGEVWGEKLAGFSYSFYVVHFPLSIVVLGLLYRFEGIHGRLPLNARGLIVASSTLAAAIVIARVFAFCTEDRTQVLRHILLAPKLADTVAQKSEGASQISA